MQCQQVNELFSDYIERRLDAALTVSVDNHLVGCGLCREEMEGLRRTWTQLDQMSLMEPPVALHAGILSALDAQLADTAHETTASHAPGFNWDLRSLFRPRTLAYAAAILIFVLGGMKVVGTQAIIGAVGSGNKVPVSAAPLSITATRSHWTANSDGGGTLAVVLKAAAPKEMPIGALNYKAELVKGDAASAPSNSLTVLASTQGRFSTIGNATVNLDVRQEKALQGSPLSLVFTLLSSENGAADDTQKVIVPLTLSNELSEDLKHEPKD